ncbi:MAG: MarR family winged helix-turn-helix transcriptional regulator [Candidatus Bathyarchaeota archaeon]|jgi:DNA-binding HxlR family transcriptional regulator
MDFIAETEWIPQRLENTSAAAFKEMIEILDALGNDDALSLFIYAEQGISSSKTAIEELNLTQKRFYSRLKDLIEAGLIEKTEGEYQYTTLGRVFSKIGYSLLDVLENKEQFELLETLRTSPSLTTQEFNKISSVVSKGSVDISSIFDMIFFSDKQGKVEVLPSYEGLVKKLAEEIKKGEKHIFLASRYIDNKVIDAMLKNPKEGKVEIKVLMAKEHLEDKVNKLQLLLSPGIILSMLEFFGDPNLNEIMRDGNVPFSFCIIDGDRCFFELPSFGNHDFTIAFFVKDTEIGNKFTKMFKTLWENADEKAMPKFMQMLKKIS